LAPLVVLDGLPLVTALTIFVAVFLSSGLITYIVKMLDPDSIISVRRTFGLALTSNLIWSIPLAAVLGAFFAWSFELLVINGAFLPTTIQSMCVALIQPAVTLLLASTSIIHLNSAVLYAAGLGFVILGITTSFLLKFKTFKTEGVGINSLQTFQSFLKTWVSHNPASLENYFTQYSQDEPVTTKIVLASAASKVALVLPGVHPGPFYPVGSYDLSELIHHELRSHDIIPMVLHGIGGHERNLPTNELAKRYAAEIARAITSPPDAGQQLHTMRGPIRLKMGSAMVTTLGFGKQVIAFLSSAPYNTDDLEPTIIDGAVSAAKERGVELMLVDAHNSIGGEDARQPEISREDWIKVFSEINESPEEEFELGVAHSSEVQFDHGSDISDGGITALVFRKHGSGYALIASDSNNVVVGLRQTVLDELKKEGVELIELCTSDTHKSAARYITNRGYHALGEDTNLDALVATIKRLERLAEERLSRGSMTAITSQLTLPLIGDRSLNDFATLTKETLSFAKSYASAALASSLVICSLALFF
jgi:putative membrane protein